ncbi:MAG: type IV toxin-antitoxin system AbiEi family antitoxin domain-containing protein [Candidatus Saliniplasma sp.]
MDKLTIIKRLESSSLAVFTTSQASALFDKGIESTRVLLSRLAKQGILVRVKRGHYCLPSTNALSVVSNIYTPSYVSLWAAFEHYGTTTQSPRVIDVINTTKSGKRELSLEEGRFESRFVKTHESFLYGIEKTYLDGKATFIAEKEKAVIDGLLFNEYVPLGEVQEAIEDGIDIDKAIGYAERAEKQVVKKRLGYLLDQAGFDCDPERFGDLSDTYVPLDPSFTRKGKYDAKWHIIDNVAEVRRRR